MASTKITLLGVFLCFVAFQWFHTRWGWKLVHHHQSTTLTPSKMSIVTRFRWWLVLCQHYHPTTLENEQQGSFSMVARPLPPPQPYHHRKRVTMLVFYGGWFFHHHNPTTFKNEHTRLFSSVCEFFFQMYINKGSTHKQEKACFKISIAREVISIICGEQRRILHPRRSLLSDPWPLNDAAAYIEFHLK